MRRRIALVAHDNMKPELLQWAAYNRESLARHDLVATGTTGTLLQFELGLRVARLLSGPVGGDLQIGARIAEGRVDLLVFFWDPLEPQPHDPDVKALLRVAVVWNTPTACNRATADLVISSPLFEESYQPVRPEFGNSLPLATVDRGHSPDRPPGRLCPPASSTAGSPSAGAPAGGSRSATISATHTRWGPPPAGPPTGGDALSHAKWKSTAHRPLGTQPFTRAVPHRR